MTSTVTEDPQVAAPVTHTALVDATEFYRSVLNAALFASDDGTLPALTTVHFTAGDPGLLQLEATNRYVASRETLDLIDPASYDSDWGYSEISDHLAGVHDVPKPDYDHRSEIELRKQHDAIHAAGADHGHTVRPVPVTDLDILVQVKGLVKITKMLKQLEERVSHGASYIPRIMIEWTEGGSHAAFTLTNQASEPDQTLRAEVATVSQFPKLDQMWPAADAEITETQFFLGRQWVAMFAKVDTGSKADSIHFIAPESAGKVAQVTIGSRFRAIVVPIRGTA